MAWNFCFQYIYSNSIDDKEVIRFVRIKCRHRDYYMSRDMTKPTKWVCAQRRLRSAWASAQSDQSLRCALNGKLRTQFFFMRTAKSLIRLGGCPGSSESSLGAQSFCWFCHVAAQSRLHSYQALYHPEERDINPRPKSESWYLFFLRKDVDIKVTMSKSISYLS